MRRDKRILRKVTEYCGNIEQSILSFGKEEEKFLNDSAFNKSCAFCIFQIGEAIKSLSFGLANSHRDVQWGEMIGLGNEVMYNWEGTDLSKLWAAINEQIPMLKVQCERILAEEEAEEAQTAPQTTVHKIYSISELKAIVAPVAERYGVKKILLFGSVARGDCDEDSDYDLCIEWEKKHDMTEFSGFRIDLCEAVGRDVDIVGANSIDPELSDIVQSEGIIIFEAEQTHLCKQRPK